MAHSGTFLNEVMAQVGENQEKWSQTDIAKNVQEFVLLAQEQLGQMAKATLDADVGGVHRECIHTVATLYEIYRRVTG